MEKLLEVVKSIVGGTASKELLQNNANKEPSRIPVQRDMVAGEVAKHIALTEILPPEVAAAHISGDIHYHDLDYAPFFPIFNCMLIDLRGMLTSGFNMGSAEIETPKSIGTATAITAQIIAQVASHIYGGNTINNIDITLAPYVRATYDKHLRKGLQILSGDERKATVYALEMTEKDTYDAFQALEYEINTLHTANGQTPFCTFGFGLGTMWEERLIQKSILQVRIAGLGKNKRTAIFPKLVFTIREGVNRKNTDVNYDIKELALKCSSERMYPDILNYDQLVKVTGGHKAPMGCVDGGELIKYRYQGESHVASFKDLWETFATQFGVKTQGVSNYLEVPNLEIMDGGKFTKVVRVIRNPDQGDWVKLKFFGGRNLVATTNHPLPVEGKGRTFVGDMVIGDRVKKVTVVSGGSNTEITTDDAYLMGMILCDGSYIDNIRISLDHRTESDVIAKVIRILTELCPLNTVSSILQERGERGTYTDVMVKGAGSKAICERYHKLFKAHHKSERRIPSFIFEQCFDVRNSFLAGMIDADGYTRDTKTKGTVELSIGTTNKALSLQQSHLMQSVGFQTNNTINESYNGRGGKAYISRTAVREYHDILEYMACEKKTKNLPRGAESKARKLWDNIEYAKLRSIEHLGNRGESSYDVETESDMFDVSGIRSHNCRSFLNEIPSGAHDGRNNMGVVSVNLPRLAIKAEGREHFYILLDEVLEVAFEGLMNRIDSLRNVKAKVAPILYVEGACGIRLDPEDNVFSLFEKGRASISLGYIGLNEMANALYFGDPEHTFDSEDKRALCLEVAEYLSSTAERWKQETGFAFSLYSTPSESLCDRFHRLDKAVFGEIKGVTDKGYYTNSFHLDVTKKVTPTEKLDFESDYPQFASGGFIEYVEFPNMRNNLKGLEHVWDYSYTRAPYVGTNTPIDQCGRCGFKGEVKILAGGAECPSCGNRDSKTLSATRRVCGYLGQVDLRPFCEGKQKEMLLRVKHMEG